MQSAHNLEDEKIDSCRQSKLNGNFLKKFLIARESKDFEKCKTLLVEGADINKVFERFSMVDHDDDCYHIPSLNDNPLTFSVRENDLVTTTFLLENKASTEIYYMERTPLMWAAYKHSIDMVDLLLKYQANPNSYVDRRTWDFHNIYSGQYTAMDYVFFGMRMLRKYKISAEKIVTLLINAGAIQTYEHIKENLIKCKCSNLEEFDQVWRMCNEKGYTQGAASGALESKIPNAFGLMVGKFFRRRDGATLAAICKNAAAKARKEHEHSLKGNSTISWR